MTGGGIGVVLGAMATGALLQQTAQRAPGDAPRPGAGAVARALGLAWLGLLPRLLRHGVRGVVRSHLVRSNCTLLGLCGCATRRRRWGASRVR